MVWFLCFAFLLVISVCGVSLCGWFFNGLLVLIRCFCFGLCFGFVFGFSMRSLLGKNNLGAGSKSMVQISGVCGGFR